MGSILESADKQCNNQPKQQEQTIPLLAWNQATSRVYMQVALCFPFNDGKDQVEKHLVESLDRLKRQRPDFAGTLHSDDIGCLSLKTTTGDVISCNQGPDFPYTYAQLVSNEFSPSAFVDPSFALDGSALNLDCQSLPVSQVRFSIIEGGLILWVYLHHSIADGEGLSFFLECFTAQTRGEKIQRPDKMTVEPARACADIADKQLLISGEPNTFEDLLRRSPEYTTTNTCPAIAQSSSTGNSEQEPKKASLFIFSNQKLQELRALVASVSPAGSKPPSASPSSPP